jgi:hypothetical protein
MFRLAGGFLGNYPIDTENIHKKRFYDFMFLGNSSRL